MSKSNVLSKRIVLSGTAVTSGVAIGDFHFLKRFGKQFNRRNIKKSNANKELERLQTAVGLLLAEFTLAQQKLHKESKEQAGILDAYIMICRDPKLLSAINNYILEHLYCAEWALEAAVKDILAVFEEMDSSYFRERMIDIQAVASRILALLQGDKLQVHIDDSLKIFLAHDLTPADTLALSPKSILALVTEMGGKTSHTGIVARSLNVPCLVGVTGLGEAVSSAGCGLIVVDAVHSKVIINPTEDELLYYQELQAQYKAYEARIGKDSSLGAVTEDGVKISVLANIDINSNLEELKTLGCEGVGLFRTEFEFISRSSVPSEAELFEEYKKVAEALNPYRVVLRTLDIGADKMLEHRSSLEEDNPALGLRGIRYCLHYSDIFRRQLRAILRASSFGVLSVMFPMISGLDELRIAKSILMEIKQELDNEGISYDKNIPIGTMIELPSAVLMAPMLAKEVDFFSIGTNDLIQYTIGVDRGNKYVAYLYEPLHPAIIHSIKSVVDEAHNAGIGICVCGEMASDPYCIPIFLAMGITELSISPQAIPAVKSLIRSSNVEDFREVANNVYASASAKTTLQLIKYAVYSRYEDELTFYTSSAQHN